MLVSRGHSTEPREIRKRQGVSIFLRNEDGRDAICGGESICLNAGVFALSIEIGVLKLLLK